MLIGKADSLNWVVVPIWGNTITGRLHTKFGNVVKPSPFNRKVDCCCEPVTIFIHFWHTSLTHYLNSLNLAMLIHAANLSPWPVQCTLHGLVCGDNQEIIASSKISSLYSHKDLVLPAYDARFRTLTLSACSVQGAGFDFSSFTQLGI